MYGCGLPVAALVSTPTYSVAGLQPNCFQLCSHKGFTLYAQNLGFLSCFAGGLNLPHHFAQTALEFLTSHSGSGLTRKRLL